MSEESVEPKRRSRRGVTIAAVVALLIVVGAFLFLTKANAPFGFIAELDGQRIPNPIPVSKDLPPSALKFLQDLNRICRYYAFHQNPQQVRAAMNREMKEKGWTDRGETLPHEYYFIRPKDMATVGLSWVKPKWNVPPGTTCIVVVVIKRSWLEEKMDALHDLFGRS